MAYVLIDAVSARKQLFGVDEKEYCKRALEGMRDRIEKIGIALDGGVYGEVNSAVDESTGDRPKGND